MDVKDYMKLPYNVRIVHRIEKDGDEYYFATVDELEGCMSHGDTYEEAAKNIQEAMELWIEAKLEDGFKVPLPKTENEYSGKFLVRIPKTLHRKLSQQADEEGISLNQYALYKLST